MTKVLLLACVPLAGCLTFSDFDLGRTVPEQTLQGSPVPAPLQSAFPFAMDLDLSANIAKFETKRQVQVTLASLELSVTPSAMPAGDSDDFGFIDELHVFISSSTEGSELPRIEIAHATNPGAVPTIEFAVDSTIDLKPYISEMAKVDAVGRGTVPSDDISFDGRGVVTVHPQ
jgi:hypothetical protein